MNCNICGSYGQLESKCFKAMEALEEAMKKHNINLDSSSSNSSSHGHALSSFGFSLNATCTSYLDGSLLIMEHLIIWISIKPSTLNECNNKKIFVGDDRSLSVGRSGTIQVDNGHFNDVLFIPSISCKPLSMYQITHLGEGKTVEF
jgi:hypothetical protein